MVSSTVGMVATAFAAPLVVPILSGGEKRCEVRFPSDEEWCAWARAQRTVGHFPGRGKSQSEDVDLPKINAEPPPIDVSVPLGAIRMPRGIFARSFAHPKAGRTFLRPKESAIAFMVSLTHWIGTRWDRHSFCGAPGFLPQ
jgi:hypothetical protein